MGSAQEKKLIVGLDIGTSKVVAIVGEIDPEGGLEVVGIGSHPSKTRCGLQASSWALLRMSLPVKSWSTVLWLKPRASFRVGSLPSLRRQ